ncbi:hypothetical protein BKA59DRAFT_468178 [Fusarium tricinctum]|uniref:Uncharacterized protein n=1 Tax=Fusarium tricinctum TaxID=61284 RepID=A0A8K0S857_9HYPO|nr:hypothetical protein BKA59DRAFT_468178 [Fusarium tricinctum]
MGSFFRSLSLFLVILYTLGISLAREASLFNVLRILITFATGSFSAGSFVATHLDKHRPPLVPATTLGLLPTLNLLLRVNAKLWPRLPLSLRRSQPPTGY